MPARVFATHDLEVREHEVIKRFRSWDRGEHQREWQALVVLAGCAPDLAPAPLGCDLDSVPPYVRMSRVPGRPLAGQAVTTVHLDAAAAAVNRGFGFFWLLKLLLARRDRPGVLSSQASRLLGMLE